MEIANAYDNRKLFIELFNRYTKYAPYTVKLDEDILNRYLFRLDQNQENRILIGTKGSESGVIHYGTWGEHVGIIHLLFADSNPMATELLGIAEEWFSGQKFGVFKGYMGYPSPYMYILHGSEPYCWAGNYPANNAFRRAGYDLELDVLVMSRNLNPDGSNFPPDKSDFEVKEEILRDDDLALAGRFIASQNGVWAGRCGYHYLKALSGQLGRKYGQVDIWLNDDFHGTGLAGILMGLAHSALTQLGVVRVMLATNQELFRAIKFYDKTGYVVEPIKAYSYQKITH